MIFGLLFRCAIIPSQQIQEDDVYRYLWDGKVFAHGINPFKFSPEEINEYNLLKIKKPKHVGSFVAPLLSLLLKILIY